MYEFIIELMAFIFILLILIILIALYAYVRAYNELSCERNPEMRMLGIVLGIIMLLLILWVFFSWIIPIIWGVARDVEALVN